MFTAGAQVFIADEQVLLEIKDARCTILVVKSLLHYLAFYSYL